MSILCITLNPALDMTLTVPNFSIGAVNRVANSQVHAAGKGLNVAQILHGLGHDVVVTGFWGQENDTPLIELCEQKNQNPKFINKFVMVSGQTRTNIKVVDDDGVTTDINGKGFLVADNNKQALFDTVKALINMGDISHVVISGSLPQGFDLVDFEQLLTVLDGLPVACDVSGDVLALALKKPLWLIKPNDEELAVATGELCQETEAQKNLINKLNIAIDNVVISQGEMGVNWFFDGKCLHATPPKVKVVSTVGAGDTLLAGMVHGLVGRLEHEQVLKIATALSANAVSIVGFDVPNQTRLDELLSKTAVAVA